MGIRASLHEMAEYREAAIGIAAVGAVVYGCGLIYGPAAWIVGGLLVLLDMLHAKRRKPDVD